MYILRNMSWQHWFWERAKKWQPSKYWRTLIDHQKMKNASFLLLKLIKKSIHREKMSWMGYFWSSRKKKNSTSHQKTPTFPFLWNSNFFFLDQGPMTKESSKKNWRGKVAKQWKRMQGSSSASNTSYPEGGSIGKSNHFIILLRLPTDWSSFPYLSCVFGLKKLSESREYIEHSVEM